MVRAAFFISVLSLIVSCVSIWLFYQQNDTQFEVTHRDNVTLDLLRPGGSTILLPRSLKKEHYIAIPIVLLIKNTGYYNTSIVQYFNFLKQKFSFLLPKNKLPKKITPLTLARLRNNESSQKKMLLNIKTGSSEKFTFYFFTKVKLKDYNTLKKSKLRLTIINATKALWKKDKARIPFGSYLFTICIETSRSAFDCASGDIYGNSSASFLP